MRRKLRTGPQAYDQDFDSTPANMALKVRRLYTHPLYLLNSVLSCRFHQ